MGGRTAPGSHRYAATDPASLLPTGLPVTVMHGTRDQRVPVQLARDYVVAARLAGDPISYTRDSGMQAVDQAMRTGQPDRALQLAEQVPDAAGTVPAFWEAGHRLHLAAACADLERWTDVADHLDAARRMAPQWTGVQPLGRVVMGHLVEHRGRRSDRITELAAHYCED